MTQIKVNVGTLIHSFFFYFLSVQFSCGLVELSTGSVTRSIQTPRSSNRTIHSSNNTLQDDYYDDLSQLYDYFDLLTNDSDVSNISQPSPINIRSVRSPSSSSVSPAEVFSSDGDLESANGIPTEERLLSWAFPELPTIRAQDKLDQRIVGGDEATPGEIPWQVPWYSLPI